MKTKVARRGLIAIVVTAALCIWPTAASAEPATQIEAMLKKGPVTLSNVRVAQMLDLRRLGAVTGSFVCRNCVFAGGVNAQGVTFAGTVDLSGSFIHGPADFEDATFKGQVLMGSPPASPARRTTFTGRGNFELATFDNLVTFQQAVFRRGADFTLAQFAADAIFSTACFGGRPHVETRELCRPATKPPPTTKFDRAVFSGPADFNGAWFDDDASFEEARFAERADLSQSNFFAEASFFKTRFGGDGDFRLALFSGPGQSTNFQFATSGGELDFEYATFFGTPQFREMSSAGAISFADAILSNAMLFMSQISTPNLYIAVPAVLASVDTNDQQAVLDLLEKSAQARGDLGTANDALFARRELISADYKAWWKRALDVVFYRWIAGYLVRPFHPLVALGLLAAVMTLIHLVPFGRLRKVRLSTARRIPPRSAGKKVVAYLHGYLDTLTLIGPGETPANRRLEVVAYRVLLACVVVGFANSNPTLRQMFDALH